MMGSVLGAWPEVKPKPRWPNIDIMKCICTKIKRQMPLISSINLSSAIGHCVAACEQFGPQIFTLIIVKHIPQVPRKPKRKEGRPKQWNRSLDPRDLRSSFGVSFSGEQGKPGTGHVPHCTCPF